MKKNTILSSVMAAGLSVGGVGCQGGAETAPENNEQLGSIEIDLTKVPSDASCLRLTVQGSTRTETKLIDLVAGAESVYNIARLPLGLATVDGAAFPLPCAQLSADTVASYLAEAPVAVRVDPFDISRIVLKLLRNGRIGVGVDFEEGPSPYIVPVASGVITKAILTVGESAGGYKMAGIPDGLGAFNNGDGTFTLLANHEFPPTTGAVRAHGAKGAFVSKWTIRSSDLTVLKGEDLIKQTVLWDAATSSFKAPASGVAFGRFCSADLAPVSAWYDAVTATGYNGMLFANGEEIGEEGRGFAHDMNGTAWELPHTGKFSWENAVAHPNAGAKTIVAGLDDSGGGQVYFYVGTKTNTGSVIDKAGLTNGTLLSIKIDGVPSEPAAGIPSDTAFTMVDLGNVANKSGATLEAESNTAGILKMNRPEDGAWDPVNPSHFYFVTTSSFTTPSRLWRLRFNDLSNLAAGGKLDMLLDGTEGQKMLDNIGFNKKGQLYVGEDPGNQDHLAKVYRYETATDSLTLLAQSDPLRFAPGASLFLTRDEENSGVIDASDILGAGWLLIDLQAHYAHVDPALVEGGQFLAVYDPAGK